MDEFQQVHATEQGIPWVNTIATSADGRAWYADTSATPNLSAEALAAWQAEVDAGGLLGLVYNDFGVVMLDGSDSLFEWVDDPAAPAPGLVPFADLPQIERSDYVFNANDSYWLSNPDEPLTGFSPMHGVSRRAAVAADPHQPDAARRTRRAVVDRRHPGDAVRRAQRPRRVASSAARRRLHGDARRSTSTARPSTSPPRATTLSGMGRDVHP